MSEEVDETLALFRKIKKEKKTVLPQERITEDKRQALAKNLMKKEDLLHLCSNAKDTVDCMVDPRTNSQRARYFNVASHPAPPTEELSPPALYKIPKIPRKITVDPIPSSRPVPVSLDEWGDPIIPYGTPKNVSPRTPPSRNAPAFDSFTPICSQQTPPSTSAVVDEWGAPPKSNQAAAAPFKIPSPSTSLIAKPEVNEWGDPIPSSQPLSSSTPSSPPSVAKQPGLDEWGEPIKKIQETSKPTDDWVPRPTSTSNEWGSSTPSASASKDEWGSSTSTPSASNDEWGSSSTPSASNTEWGSSSSYGGSSYGENSRGRGRGRGNGERRPRGRGGPGRGGGGPREPRDDDWTCAECGCATNFSRRTECFKCQAPKPGGGDNSRPANGGWRGGGGGGKRDSSSNSNYEPVVKRGRYNFNDFGASNSQSNKNNADEWGSTASIVGSGASSSLVDEWGSTASVMESSPTPPKNDWGRGAAKPLMDNMDEWGSSGASQTTPKTDWGSNAKNIAPKSQTDWGSSNSTGSRPPTPKKDTDWGSISANSTPKNENEFGSRTPTANNSFIKPERSSSTSKNMAEWVCQDTRCGNTNFDWREDCLRCGATKTGATVNVNQVPRSRGRDNHRYQGRDYRRDSRSPSSSVGRIKAPPDDKNLKRTLSLSSSLEKEPGVNIATETPSGWCYCGKETKEIELLPSNYPSNQTFLPLTCRFEAVAQSAAGGPSVRSSALMSATSEILEQIPARKFARKITQKPEVTIKAPRTRERGNNTWISLQMTVANFPIDDVDEQKKLTTESEIQTVDDVNKEEGTSLTTTTSEIAVDANMEEETNLTASEVQPVIKEEEEASLATTSEAVTVDDIKKEEAILKNTPETLAMDVTDNQQAM